MRLEVHHPPADVVLGGAGDPTDDVAPATDSKDPAAAHLPPQCIGDRLPGPTAQLEARRIDRSYELGDGRRSPPVEEEDEEQVAQLDAGDGLHPGSIPTPGDETRSTTEG